MVRMAPFLRPTGGEFTSFASIAISMLASFLFALTTPFANYDLIVLHVPPVENALGFHFGFILRHFLTHKPKLVYDYVDDVLEVLRYRAVQRGQGISKRWPLEVFLHIMKIMMTRSDSIVCATEALRYVMIQRGFNPELVTVIHNGVDVERFKPATVAEKIALRRKFGLPPDCFVLVGITATGWLFYNLEPFAAAVGRLKTFRKDLKTLLLLVGKRDKKVRSLLESGYGLKDRVIDFGEIAHKDMPEVLRSADVGIIPLADFDFNRHALPVKLFEYCACGLPILGTAPANSLMGSTVRKYSLGFVFPPQNIGGIIDAVRNLEQDKGQGRGMRSRSRKVMVREFNRKKLSERYTSLIEKITLLENS